MWLTLSDCCVFVNRKCHCPRSSRWMTKAVARLATNLQAQEERGWLRTELPAPAHTAAMLLVTPKRPFIPRCLTAAIHLPKNQARVLMARLVLSLAPSSATLPYPLPVRVQ